MSLLAPLYLLGLLGLLLPWLLHRFSHHEPPQQTFPSTQFLEPTKPPATSKRKLRYWLLLALRVLFLAALCFLFAQPWLRSDADAANAEAVQLVIVDHSFSMQANDRWQQAQAVFDSVLSDLPAQDDVQLFSFASKLRALTDMINDRGLVKDAMARSEPGFESADFGELMRRLNKVAGDIKKPVSATFITDAQRSNLPQQMNTLLANRLSSFKVMAIDDTAPINYSLRADARTSDAISARVSVRVAASGADKDAAERATPVTKTVEVSIKDRVLDSQNVVLQAGESRTIVFDAIDLPSTNKDLIRVNFAQSDFLSEDDSIDVPVRGSSAINLSLTSIGNTPEEQAMVFISTAMETNGEARVETLDASTALAPGVRHAVVFVDSLNRVPDAVVRYVQSGGNALVLPNKTDESTAGSSSANASNITRVDLAHALGLGDIDWFSSHYYNVPEFTPLPDDRLLLSLDTGQALLIERSIGDLGRLLLLNDSLDGFNSDLPLQPSFVLLMQQIVHYFDSSSALPDEVEVGSDIYLPANTQLLTPAGDAILELSQLGTPNSVRITEPGIYSVLGANSAQSVSALISSRELNMAGLDREELDAWEARHEIKKSSQDLSDETNGSVGSRVVDEIQTNNTLWRWLLPAVLIFLLLESLYANRFLWVRRDGL